MHQYRVQQEQQIFVLYEVANREIILALVK
jgi:hypothetical protein